MPEATHSHKNTINNTTKRKEKPKGKYGIFSFYLIIGKEL